MRKRRGLWIVYRVCAVAVVAAMAWLTSDLLALERSQARAAAHAAHQTTLRLALWRMDSWLGPALIAETTENLDGERHIIFERLRLSPGAPPQMTHFSFDARDPPTIRSADEVESALATIDLADAAKRIDASGLTEWISGGPTAPTSNDYAQRLTANFANQAASNNAAIDLGPQDIGPLTSMWVRPRGGEPILVFLRRTVSSRSVSGFKFDGGVAAYVADWDKIRRNLLAEAADLLPQARLRAWESGDSDPESAFILASAPIALESPSPPAAALPLWTPTRITLGVAWLAITASIAAFGVALKRTVDLSDRRSRFASSVTHELRTPLTTFRLYSEMLADDMVTDPAQRRVYLETLKSESSRLAALVENVLAYARVEEGRMPIARERIAVADLLLRLTPPLDRRAAEARMTLSVDAADAAAAVVDVDPNVVGQILFNLVDNACKYCEISPGREISLQAARRSAAVGITVTDHGPGIAPDRVRAAFAPFERAGRPAGDSIPGIGLGLALSRALARDLGGDLDYEPAVGGGACFVLTLPSVRARATP